MKNIIKKIGGLCLGIAMLSGSGVTIYSAKANQVDATAAPVNTILWNEEFSGFSKDDVPEASNASTTVFGGDSLTYTCTTKNTTATKIWTENTAGGTSPELLVAKSGGSFTATNIPTGSAKEITLKYNTNQSALAVSCSSTAYTLSAYTASGKTYTRTLTLNEGETAPDTFNISFSMSTSSNARLDNINLKITKAGGESRTITDFFLLDEDSEYIEDGGEINVLGSGSSATYTVNGEVEYSSGDPDYDFELTSEDVGISFAEVSDSGDCAISFSNNGEYTIVATPGGDETKAISFTCIVTGIVVQNYSLYSGSLSAGEYIIVGSNEFAMGNVVTSNRLSYPEVSVVNDVISTTDSSIVWTIAQVGDYWTIYNEDAGKYAAATGARNAIRLDSVISDNAYFESTGTETYEFVSKVNKAASVNANIRYNPGNGFACYSTSTGSSLKLYKKVNTASDVADVEVLPEGNITIDGQGLVYEKTETVLYRVVYSGEPGDGRVSVTVSPELGLSYSDDKDGTITLTATLNGSYVLTISSIDLDTSGDPITVTKNVTVQNLTVRVDPIKITQTSDLQIGDTIFFAINTTDYKNVAGPLETNYLTSKSATFSGNYMTAYADAIDFKVGRHLVTKDSTDIGAWTFESGDGLLGMGTDKNTISLGSNLATHDFKLSFDNGNAVVESVNTSGLTLQFNSRFSCYTSSQKAIQIYAIHASETAVANEFETNYLVMGKSVEGQCREYYPTAKLVYNSLTPAQKAEISDEGMDRLEDWALAHGDVLNDGLLTNSVSKMGLFGDNGSNATWIIVAVSLAGLTAIGGYFFYKKRKENF